MSLTGVLHTTLTGVFHVLDTCFWAVTLLQVVHHSWDPLGHFLCSRIPPVETALFDWILLVLLIVSRVDFIVFVLFLEAVGVRKYCCTAVESVGSSVLRAFSASNGSANPRPSELVAWALPKAAKATFVKLHSAESCQSCSSCSRCWQHGIETARCFRRVIHAGEQN